MGCVSDCYWHASCSSMLHVIANDTGCVSLNLAGSPMKVVGVLQGSPTPKTPCPHYAGTLSDGFRYPADKLVSTHKPQTHQTRPCCIISPAGSSTSLLPA